MKRQINLLWVLLVPAIFFLNSCKEATTTTETDVMVLNMDSVKAEIAALEAAYSTASNARDVDGIAAYYADDAQSLADDEPTRVGMEAIKAGIKKDMDKDSVGSTVSFEVTGVWACDNYATETGTSTVKNKDGNVIHTGKYMTLFEKRNGKYIAIRDIWNSDAPEKAMAQ